MRRTSARLLIAAALCFWLASPNPALAQTASFTAAVDYAVGNNPQWVAVGDFNGDGRQDLAVANAGSNTVSVLLGNGDGTFQPARNFAVGRGPQSVAVGDFNGDGRRDLVVTNFGSFAVPNNTISVLLGNGDGTFQPARDFVVGINPNFVAVADFNGDGRQDLAVANFGNNTPDATTVSVLLGNGDGTFQAARTFNAQRGPLWVAAGDFNGDGRQDLAVADFGAAAVSVLLGNGDGTFQAARNFAVGSGPASVAVGDFNGDGRQDLAVTIYGDGTATIVSVLLGNGDGTFQTPRNFGVGPGPVSGAVGDFNGDGRLDIVTANWDRNAGRTVSVLLGNGDGTFQAAQNFLAGQGVAAVAVGDFNLDGAPDLATGNYAAGTVSVLLNNTVPAPTFTLTVIKDGSGSGTVASSESPPRIDCGPACATASASYNSGTPVTLTASPAGGSTFAGWTGGCAGIGPCTVTMTAATMVTATFMIGQQQVAPPSFSPPGGTYVGSVTVALSTTTSGATIHYTTDGSPPTPASPVYTGPVSVMRTTTIGAMATANGMTDSAVVSATYAIRVAAPTFSLPSGTYNQPQTVALSTTTSGATIHYTTDGTTPTASSPVYTGPISVTQTTTIGAMATASGMTDSTVASGTYTLQAATPTFSPPGGAYLFPQSVTISSASPGVTIYYTTDGTTPTTSSPVYIGPILVVTTTTIRAIAAAPGWSQSSVASATYTTLRVATPTFSPVAGTYVGSATVTLSDATSGATIHYTTDGTTPTTSSPVYTGPVSVAQTTTIGAMAEASGMADSGVSSATYTIVLQQVATPTFSPASGTYVGSVTVALSTTTSGATIHYTSDGTTPTTSSPVYTGPVSVTQTTTIRAMAEASGMIDSGVASATYTIRVTTPTFSPVAGMYVGTATVTLSDATSGATIHYTTDGTTPTTSSPVYTGPVSVTQTTTIRAMAEASGMADSAVASATYTIRVTAPTFSPASGTYVGSATVTLSDATSGATIHYTSDGTTPTASSPVYTGAITVTQTTTIRAMAEASGMADSFVASATYTIQQRVATPTLSPAGGTYIGSVTVTLSDATSGATIHYTTDGSTPTASSPVYTGAITVTQTTTIRAMATASGMADSFVASATYTIQQAFTLTVSIQRILTGNGTVTSSPSGINCGADCSGTYTSGTTVTLTATPAFGSVFVGWGGACSGILVPTCTVTMTGDMNVFATFGI